MKDNTYQYYAGNMVCKNNKSLNYLLFDEGLVTKTSSVYSYEYHLKDHLGNTRITFQPNGSTTTTTQVAEYYPFGSSYSPISPAGTNKYLYNGKEKQDDVLSSTALDWYDYGARFYDPMIGRFHVIDRFAEKYASMAPYQYGANNPISFIDINGDSVSVAEKYREQFNKTLTAVFGDKAKNFSYTKTGMLTYSGTEKDFKGDAKDVFSQFSGTMNESTTTNMIYEESTQITLNDGTKATVKASDGGGALTVLAGENNVSENTILVSPSAKTEFNVFATTPAYYISPIDPANGARFTETKVKSNSTDMTFHEFGHVINRGKSQDRVINFNNKVRKILGTDPRPYDETHNRNVIKGNY